MKERWAAFIADSPARAYLFARGESSILERDGRGAPAAEVDHFLARLSRSSDARLLGHIFLLLGPTAREFVIETLPPLVRALTHIAARTERTLRGGGVRGRVQWSKTVQRRVSGRLDRASFVVHDLHRTANRPENQLLKLLLIELEAAYRATADAVGAGSMPREMIQLAESVSDALASPLMRDVAVPSAGTPRMRLAARRDREPGYAVAADLLATFEQLGGANKWQVIRDLVLAGWLAPLSEDDLFELYTLTLVIDVLVEEFTMKPLTWSLLSAGRGPVCQLEDGVRGEVVEVFFDQSPVTVSQATSRYAAIANSYPTITASGRRPDVLVKRVSPADSRWLIIEVKKTTDGTYTRESIYKAFGYLYDFEELFDGVQRSRGPAVMLMLPGKVDARGPGLEPLRLCSGDDRTRLTGHLKEFLAV